MERLDEDNAVQYGRASECDRYRPPAECERWRGDAAKQELIDSGTQEKQGEKRCRAGAIGRRGKPWHMQSHSNTIKSSTTWKHTLTSLSSDSFVINIIEGMQAKNGAGRQHITWHAAFRLGRPIRPEGVSIEAHLRHDATLVAGSREQGETSGLHKIPQTLLVSHSRID